MFADAGDPDHVDASLALLSPSSDLYLGPCEPASDASTAAYRLSLTKRSTAPHQRNLGPECDFSAAQLLLLRVARGGVVDRSSGLTGTHTRRLQLARSPGLSSRSCLNRRHPQHRQTATRSVSGSFTRPGQPRTYSTKKRRKGPTSRLRVRHCVTQNLHHNTFGSLRSCFTLRAVTPSSDCTISIVRPISQSVDLEPPCLHEHWLATFGTRLHSSATPSTESTCSHFPTPSATFVALTPSSESSVLGLGTKSADIQVVGFDPPALSIATSS